MFLLALFVWSLQGKMTACRGECMSRNERFRQSEPSLRTSGCSSTERSTVIAPVELLITASSIVECYLYFIIKYDNSTYSIKSLILNIEKILII